MVEVQILQDAYTDVSGRQRPELVVEQISASTSLYIAAPVHPCTRGIPYILYIIKNPAVLEEAAGFLFTDVITVLL